MTRPAPSGLPIPIGPKHIHRQVAALSKPIRTEALMICATCREKHGGWCMADLTADPVCCPAVEMYGLLDGPEPPGPHAT